MPRENVRRITKKTHRDSARTKELDIDELEVIEYKDAVLLTTKGSIMGPFFFAVDKEDIKPACPICGADGENHERFEKTYKDCIYSEEDGYIECLVRHSFVKYICRQHKPNSIFSKEYDFADGNNNITRRFENRVIRLSMEDSVTSVPNKIRGTLSKQSVSEIVNRWIANADKERGGFPDTEKLIIMSCSVAEEDYAFFAYESFNGLSIIDVIFFKASADIITELNKFDLTKLKIIVTDFNPIIREAVQRFSGDDVAVIIDVSAIREWIEMILVKAMKVYAKQVATNVKDEILAPASYSKGGWLAKQRDEALGKRPKLKALYHHVNWLRDILNYSEDLVEDGLYEWLENVPELLETDLKDISTAIDHSFEDVINYYRRRTVVTEDTYRKIKNLHEKLQQWKNCKNPDLMRARLLYAGFIGNLEELSENQWYGIGYDNVLENINRLINRVSEGE